MANHEALSELKIDRAHRRAPRRNRLWWLAGLLLLAGIVAGPRMFDRLMTVKVKTASVTKLTAKPGMGDAVELTAAGYVVADRQSVVATKLTGRLSKLLVSESQKVKQGELIAEIDHADLDALAGQLKAEQNEASVEASRMRDAAAQAEAQLAAARAPLDTADAVIKEMELKLADAKRKLERDKKVAQQDALAFSVVDDRIFDVNATAAQIATTQARKTESLHAVTVAEKQAAMARTAVAAAEAHERTVASRLNVLKAQIADAYVYAPFDGVVTEKAAEVGEIVAPISIGGSMARGSIATIADWNSLQAEVDVAEAYIGRVKAGGRAAITVDAFPNKSFPGKVRRVLPRANRTKATVQVRVDFTERDDGVLPEMGVRVKFIAANAPPGIESGTFKEKLQIPQAAVRHASHETFVWVIKDSIAHKRLVTLGAAQSETVEVEDGLSDGEQVAAAGSEAIVADGQKVRTEE